MNEAQPVCARNQAMRLDAWHAQTFRHFALGKARAVIKPRRPSAELLIAFVERLAIRRLAFRSLLFFSWREIFFMMQSACQDDNEARPR